VRYALNEQHEAGRRAVVLGLTATAEATPPRLVNTVSARFKVGGSAILALW
jgi:hypothetical protein